MQDGAGAVNDIRVDVGGCVAEAGHQWQKQTLLLNESCQQRLNSVAIGLVGGFEKNNQDLKSELFQNRLAWCNQREIKRQCANLSRSKWHINIIDSITSCTLIFSQSSGDDGGAIFYVELIGWDQQRQLMQEEEPESNNVFRWRQLDQRQYGGEKLRVTIHQKRLRGRRVYGHAKQRP